MKKSNFLKITEIINAKYITQKPTIILVDNKNIEVVRANINGPLEINLDNLSSPKIKINADEFSIAIIKCVKIICGDTMYTYDRFCHESICHLDSSYCNSIKLIENINYEDPLESIIKEDNREGKPLLGFEELVELDWKNLLSDSFEEIFQEEIRKFGKEGYYIEICHYNYTRTFLYIDATVEMLPSKVYAKFRDDYKDKVLYVALVKFKGGAITYSRKKTFKLPCYHIEFAVELIINQIKGLKKLYNYFDGLKVETSLLDRAKIAWEHKFESEEVVNYQDSFNIMNDYKTLLSQRRCVKDINAIICGLNCHGDFKKLMSINLESVLLDLEKALKLRKERILSAKEEWGLTANKLIVIRNELLQEDLYKDITRKYNRNAYDPYTERLIAYTTIY